MTQSDAESVSLGMILCMRGKYMTFSWLTVTQELNRDYWQIHDSGNKGQQP